MLESTRCKCFLCRPFWAVLLLAGICLLALAATAFPGAALAIEADSQIGEPASVTSDSSDGDQTVVLSLSSDSDFQAIKDSAAYDIPDGVCDRDGAYSLLAMVNDLRSQVGASSLSWDSDLEATALVRARELAQSFSHTRPDGTSCFTAFPSVSAAGENIAAGYRSASAAFNGWYNSSGHYANMVSTSYRSVGMACFISNGTRYWVQCFSGSSGDGARFSSAESGSDVQKMLRLYNPNSGEHFYTASAYERDVTAYAGWNYEGIGWTAPVSSSTPVYRLYNPNPGPNGSGEHHYTTSSAERDSLIAAGWSYEGVGWYSDDAKSVPLYRVYNPNEYNNNHHYTTSKDECDYLLGIGWNDEGIAWYGV